MKSRRDDRVKKPVRTTAALTMALALGIPAPATAYVRLGTSNPVAKPTTSKATAGTYYLRREDCGRDDFRLSTKDGPDATCTDVYAGQGTDVLEELDLATRHHAYQATDGLPLVLNVKKPITGEITLDASECMAEGVCVPGIGVGSLSLVVRGEPSRGRSRELAQHTEMFALNLLSPSQTISFKLWPDDWFHKNRFKGLSLDLELTAESVGFVSISYDDPASSIRIPAIDKGRG